MRFMIIVKAGPESEAGVMPAAEGLDEMERYHEELAKAGVLLDASGLKASSMGWRVQYRNGQRSIIDGPSTESNELITRYTLIDVRSRDEAIEWTRRFPNPAPDGTDCEIEVRQLFE